MDKLLTVKELAALLDLSQLTIRRMVYAGELPAIRIGSRVRFNPDDIAAYLAARREVTNDPA